MAYYSDRTMLLFIASPASIIIPVLSLAVILLETLRFFLSMVLFLVPWFLLSMLNRGRLRFLLVCRRSGLLSLITHCRTLVLRSRMNRDRLDRNRF